MSLLIAFSLLETVMKYNETSSEIIHLTNHVKKTAEQALDDFLSSPCEEKKLPMGEINIHNKLFGTELKRSLDVVKEINDEMGIIMIKSLKNPSIPDSVLKGMKKKVSEFQQVHEKLKDIASVIEEEFNFMKDIKCEE